MKNLESAPLVAQIQIEAKKRSAALLELGIEPHIAAVLIGEDEQSIKYLEIKRKQAQEVGIILSVYHLEADASVEEAKASLAFLAQDEEVHGIILQLPLPETFKKEQVNSLIEVIPEHKDVDGLRPLWQAQAPKEFSLQEALQNDSFFLPPMVLSIFSLLEFYEIKLEGATIVSVGEGRLVGAPFIWTCKHLGLKAEAVNLETEQIISHTSAADILITGTGEKDLITYQWIKEGAVVINCSNDVHVDSVSQVASALSPAKGGVGPLTTAWLLHNTLKAISRHGNSLN